MLKLQQHAIDGITGETVNYSKVLFEIEAGESGRHLLAMGRDSNPNAVLYTCVIEMPAPYFVGFASSLSAGLPAAGTPMPRLCSSSMIILAPACP